MRDASTGWVAGGCHGGITFYRTDNGGATWRRQELRGSHGEAIGQNDCSSVCALNPPRFTSALDATMVFTYNPGTGQLSALFTTHDGGATWSPHAFPAVTYFDVGQPFFADRNHGWVAQLVQGSSSTTNLSRVFGTTDGGVTWTALTDFPGASITFDFLTPSDGFAVISGEGSSISASLQRTTDGGRTWIHFGPRLK